MSATPIAVRFVPRAEPLLASAIAAPRAVWPALVKRLLREPDASLAELRGAVTEQTAVIVGEASRLPWVDGLVFLGRDERAPRLLMPTALAPNVPMELFARALFKRHPDGVAPALLLDPMRVVDVRSASPLDRQGIEAWRRRWQS